MAQYFWLGEDKKMIFEKKRSEIEILNEILITAQKKAKKTSLLYNTNLCYNHFTEYLNFLLEKNFIDIKNEIRSGNTYHITEKGEKFLNSIENVIKQSRGF